MSRLAPALALLVLCALLIVGCGGGEEEPTATTGTATATTEKQGPQGKAGKADAEQQRQARQGEAKPQGGAEEKSPSKAHQRQIKNPPIASTRTPGQKAVAPGVPTSKGSDNSIQVFGTEGQQDDASQAARALSAYLAAVAAEEWDRACQQASAQFREELGKLIEQAKTKGDAKKPQGCAEILELILGAAKGAATFAAQAPRKVLSFRVEAPYAYLIYEDTQGKIRFIAMAGEDGGWKVNVPQSSELQTAPGATANSRSDS